MMKKLMSALAAVLLMAMMHGCGAEAPSTEAPAQAAAPAAVADPAPAASEAEATEADTPAQADAGETVVVAADDGEDTPAPARPDAPSPYRLGDHYSVLTPAQPTSTEPGKVEITEVFMYGCPACFNFEPFIERWVPNKATNVEFVRLPALFNAPARVHARAYYTAETLGVLEESHMPFFREIHVNRKRMTDLDELASFFERYGVEPDTFRQTYNSFAVDTKLRRADGLVRRYRASSTPTVVVNGKYVVDGDKITSYQQILEIADYLAAKEAAGG